MGRLFVIFQWYLNRLLLTLTVFIVLSLLCFGKSSNRNEYISDYIKVWSRVKYYIQNDEASEDFDSVFVNHIEKLLKNESKRIFNIVIKEVLNTPTLSQNSPTEQNVDNQDLIHADISSLSNSNMMLWLKLIQQKLPVNAKYLEFDPELGIPIIMNEKLYPVQFPETSIRLLSLARFYGIIEFFYPYRYMLDRKWAKMVNEFVSPMINCHNANEYHYLVLELACLVNDSHSEIQSLTLDKFWGNFYLPMKLEMVDSQFVVTSIFTGDNLINPFKIGDVILKIGERDLIEWRYFENKYLWGSNRGFRDGTFASRCIRSDEPQLSVKILRKDEEHIINSQLFTRYELRGFSEKSYYFSEPWFIEDSLLYVNLSQVDSIELRKLMEKNTIIKDVIFDMRFYPNWILPLILEYFPSSELPFVQFATPSQVWLGLFNDFENLYLDKPIKYKRLTEYRIGILVNHNTISRGEFSVMALQSLKNSTTFGSSTAGADGNVASFVLPGNISIRFSAIGIQYPDGRLCQGQGISIDYLVSQSYSDLLLNDDTQLSYVIKYFKDGIE